MPAPTIEFDGTTYTVTLFRADEKEYFVFGQHTLSVCSAREDQLESSEREMIKSTADAEGILYYIHAQPRDLGPAERVGLENKGEALAINRVLLVLEEHEDAVHDVEDEDENSTPEAEEDIRDWQRDAVERDW